MPWPIKINKMKTEVARYIIESISLSHTKLKSTKKPDIKKILFDPNLASKTIGIQIRTNDIIKILKDIGFKTKKKGKILNVEVPSWRPDISGQIDIVEEIIRIYGYNNIPALTPNSQNKMLASPNNKKSI